MLPYYLTFSEGKQLLWLPGFCGFLFVSKGNGSFSMRASWRAKPTSEGAGSFIWGGSEGGGRGGGQSVLYLEVHLFTIKLLNLP